MAEPGGLEDERLKAIQDQAARDAAAGVTPVVTVSPTGESTDLSLKDNKGVIRGTPLTSQKDIAYYLAIFGRALDRILGR